MNVYAYARVSARDQNLDRQIEAFTAFGVEKSHIFCDKKSGRELLCPDESTFFTPLYENTEIRHGVYEDRRLIGRNIRGRHAKLYRGILSDVETIDQGPVFVSVKLNFKFETSNYVGGYTTS